MCSTLAIGLHILLPDWSWIVQGMLGHLDLPDEVIDHNVDFNCYEWFHQELAHSE